jgi:AcrR family transcriptional regulator
MPKVVPAYRDEARSRITEVAKSLFVERGFHGTSMDDIAAAVGVSKGALYLYFPGKIDLLRAIQAQSREYSRQWMDDAVNTADPSRDLLGIFDDVFERVADRRHLALWSELMGASIHDAEIRAAISLDHREDRRSLGRFLARLQERGLLDPAADLEVLTFALIALFQGAVWEIMLGLDAARTRRCLEAGLRATLRPPPGGSNSARGGRRSRSSRAARRRPATAPQ